MHEGDNMDIGFSLNQIVGYDLNPNDIDNENFAWNRVHGSPREDALNYIGQTTDFTCAIVSQQMILKSFGIDISEARLVYDATANGWLSTHGTPLCDVGRLLEHYGIDTHSHHGGGVESLISELAHGHKIIAAVDSGELWGADWFFEDWIQPEGADHALLVTGIDLSDPSHPRVFVNDPGEPGGAGHSYPLEKFLEAWNDSGRYFVATNDAPPNLTKHPIFGPGFNENSGLYLDNKFWFDLAANVAGVLAAEAVNILLNQGSISDTVGEIAMLTIESLTDTQRNNILNQI